MAPSLEGLARRYRVDRVIGQGGMGVVYAGYDDALGRPVAIKTILDVPDARSVHLFQKEWQVLASLNHPNVVEIFDIGESSGKRPYFVMPLLEGKPLSELIRESPTGLPGDRVSDILLQTCRGLLAAHSKGLVHRDIKPSNIFVLDDFVKLIDFGVVHLTTNTTFTRGLGTTAYMAPEQVLGESCTPLSDQFSLGVVSFEALTGKRPFDGSTITEVEKAIVAAKPPRVTDLRPDVGPMVSRVVLKSLARRPELRFADVRQFASHFNEPTVEIRSNQTSSSCTKTRSHRCSEATRSFCS